MPRRCDMWNEGSQKGSARQLPAKLSPVLTCNISSAGMLGLILEMRLPKILAMFLLGFYAYRRGFFQDLSDHQPFIRRVLVYGLVLGLVGNIAFAALAGKEAVFPPSPAGIAGVISYAFGVPALALGFIALVATLWQKAAWRRCSPFWLRSDAWRLPII